MIGFIIAAVVLCAGNNWPVRVAVLEHDTHLITHLRDVLAAELIAKETIAIKR